MSINRAKLWAIDAHAGQLYGGVPYVIHLAAVETVIVQFLGNDKELRAAAWLHDIVEDVDGVTREDVETEFGARVALAVWAVTGVGANRKERNTNAHEKIRMVGFDAIALKLSDLIANVEAGGKTGMYRKEHPDFKAALYGIPLSHSQHLLIESMWQYLEQALQRDVDF